MWGISFRFSHFLEGFEPFDNDTRVILIIERASIFDDVEAVRIAKLTTAICGMKTLRAFESCRLLKSGIHT